MSEGLPVIRHPIRERSWSVGNKNFLWSDVEHVEAGAWNSPLIVRITFRGGKGFRLTYPGESASSGHLLRQMRRWPAALA